MANSNTGMELPIDIVFAAIERERKYQDGKWGNLRQRPHSIGEWLLIIKGELDEAIEAWRKNKGDGWALCEVTQVASVAVACMQNCGVVEREETEQLIKPIA